MVPLKTHISNNETYKKQTFSGYKRTQVVNALKKCILKQEVDRACKWGVELDISGYTEKLWEILILFSCHEINIINPNLPIYLWKRYEEFLKIKQTYNSKDITSMKNNQESRNRLCDLICVLALSPKKKMPKFQKMTHNFLDIEALKDKMLKKKHLIKNLLKEDDPIELQISINEIANYLSLNKKGTNVIEKCFFWLDWLFYYEKLHIGKHGNFYCSFREIDNVEPKYFQDCVWLIWEMILKEVEKYKFYDYYDSLKKSINSLFNLYKTDFKKGKKNLRVIFIKYGLLLLLNCNPKIDYKTPIFHKDFLRIRACANINKLYDDINRYKQRPKENKKRTFVVNDSIFSLKKREPFNQKFQDYLEKLSSKRNCPQRQMYKQKIIDKQNLEKKLEKERIMELKKKNEIYSGIKKQKNEAIYSKNRDRLKKTYNILKKI